MKNIYQIILCILVLATYSLPLQAQNSQSLSPQVRHVTVFRDRAQIISTVSSNLQAGITQLIIEGLPAKIDKQSIGVTAKSSIIILAVKHQMNYTRPQLKSGRLTQLEDSLTFYTSRLERYTYTKDVLTKEQQMLMSNQAIGGTQTGVTVEKLKQMADFFRNRLTEINEKLTENERNLRLSQLQVSHLQNQLNELNTKRNQPSSEILVSVSAKNNTPAELELNYIVENAGWAPVYDLRASEGRNQVQLSYKANVYQRTGVDWNNARITLSTANPSQGGSQPVINALFVDLYQPEPTYPASNARVRKKRLNVMEAPELIEQEADGIAVPEEKSETVADYTQVEESGLSVAFDIALPYTIVSGGSPQLVDIQTYELPATYSYVAVPKLDADAFLTALVSGWEKYNLISGNANIYFGGTFVGESFLNAQHTEDTLRLSLGRDKKLVIKREKVNEFSSMKTIGSSVRETLTYRITLRNTKKEPVLLTLQDQIPVSKNNQIEVELQEARNASFNKETGILSWDLLLAPTQSQTIDIKYSVKYPKDKQITGI